MVKGTLTMALDFQKKKGVPHEKYSYRRSGVWYFVSCGPGYSNTYKITETDAAGEEALKKIERTEESKESSDGKPEGQANAPT